MSFDSQTLDAIVSAFGWLLGLSMLLVGGSVVAFGFWWAQALESPGFGKLVVRAALVYFGIALVTFGLAALSIGTEAGLGYPFGDSSGGLVLFAYLAGMRLTTFELATSHGLLHQLSERTDSGFVGLCAVATAAALVLFWCLTLLHTFICFVVSLNMAFGG